MSHQSGDEVIFVFVLVGTAIMVLAAIGGLFSSCEGIFELAASGLWYLFYGLIVVGGLLLLAAYLIRRPHQNARHSTPPAIVASVSWIGLLLIGLAIVGMTVVQATSGLPSCTLTLSEWIASVLASWWEWLVGLWPF